MEEILSGSLLKERLRQAFVWRGDRVDAYGLADTSGWWRDADILLSIAPALVAPFAADSPTVVVGVESSGFLIGALAAHSLGVGFAAVSKNPSRSAHSEGWWEATTPVDYRDRNLRLGVRREHLKSGDRVLAVDDWCDTGGQLRGVQDLVRASGAHWLGAATVVDALDSSERRLRLNLRSLLRIRELL